MPEHIASDALDKLPSMCALNFVDAKNISERVNYD